MQKIIGVTELQRKFRPFFAITNPAHTNLAACGGQVVDVGCTPGCAQTRISCAAP